MRNIQLLDSILAIIVLIIILIASVVLAGCAPSPQAIATLAVTRTPENTTLPRLRIKNSGATDIKHLTVLFPNSRIAFGDVPAGATTEYQLAPRGVYNYAAYEYERNGQTVTQPVIDWVGESPRPGAAYTYVIALDLSQPAVQAIHLVQVLADNAEY